MTFDFLVMFTVKGKTREEAKEALIKTLKTLPHQSAMEEGVYWVRVMDLRGLEEEITP